MKETPLELQICYEIAMSIGNSLDLSRMLKQSLSTYLRKLNCKAGIILKNNFSPDSQISFEQVFSIPRSINSYADICGKIPLTQARLEESKSCQLLQTLPLTYTWADNQYCHVMELPDFGLLLLIKSTRPLPDSIITSLQSINQKLAGACQACLQREKADNLVDRLKDEVAERKKAEESLLASKQKYQSVFENIQDVYFELTPSGHILEVSPSARRLFGSPRTEIIGQWIGDYSTDNARRLAFMEILENRGQVYDYELHLQSKNGKTFTCAINAVYQKDENANPLKITGSIRDISQRKTAEIALKIAKENAEATSGKLRKANTELHKLNRAVEQSPIMVVITDPKGCIEYVNPKFIQHSGYSAEEATGQNMSFLKSGKQDDEFYEKLWTAISAGNEWAGELLNKAKNGRLYWEQTFISPVKDENGGILHYIALKEDITWRKEAESSLFKAQEEINAAKAARSQFLANISHEIITPLNGVIGMSSLMLGTSLDNEQSDIMNTIQLSANSLMAAVNNILDYAKIMAGQLNMEVGNFDLELMLTDVMEMMKLQIGEKPLVLNFKLYKDTPLDLKGDSRRLKQVMINLIENAIKFTESGHIDVHAQSKAEKQDRVTLEISVSDTGIGVEKSCLDTIFDGFEQQDKSMSRRYGGTGIGLAICKALVEQMQGSIGVLSHQGQGATFWFRVNLTKRKATRRKKKTVTGSWYAKAPAASETPIKPILVVEDNLVNQKLTMKLLEKMGYEAEVVPNGKEAVEAVCHKDYSLVLMDIQMPEMDGLEATRVIRSKKDYPKTSSIPIIALTAHAMKGDRETCLQAGMNDYLSKPVDPQQLLNIIEKYMCNRKINL
ncbi:MAG: PAS domain S-box protein [Desulfobacteraceae bacterium]|nr:PAS domain S-box protein [Desulfobacteraceae bacterium]